MSEPFDIVLRRVFRCAPAFLFDAWTQPEHLVKWWGPNHVTCSRADVDLRVGGHYAIHNKLPDGSTIIIKGTFLEIDAPSRLVYSWATADGVPEEQVSVQFNAVDGGTELVLRHSGITDPATHRSHSTGWIGCMDGLDDYVGA